MSRRSSSPASGSSSSLPPAPSTLGPLYRLMLDSLATRARLGWLSALGLTAVVVGFALRVSDVTSVATAWVRFANTFGLSLYAPVCALLFASAALGNPAEDGTLVYLWLRPVRRSRLALAAFAAAVTLAVPLVVVSLTLGALAAGAGADVLWGTAVAHAVAVVGYCGPFLWLGLRTRRPLAWGLGYLLIWEGFVATATAGVAQNGGSAGASGVARLALRSYTRSVLSEATGVSLRLGEGSMLAGILVPLLVAAAFVWLTGRRLRHSDVA